MNENKLKYTTSNRKSNTTKEEAEKKEMVGRRMRESRNLVSTNRNRVG